MTDKNKDIKVLEYGESLEWEGIQWSELCLDNENAFEHMKADFLKIFSDRKDAEPRCRKDGTFKNDYDIIKDSKAVSDWFYIDNLFVEERIIKQ